jgi:hypothetical protein
MNAIGSGTLPTPLRERLARYCDEQGEQIEAVLADAVEMFLDERARDLVIDAASVMPFAGAGA